MRVGRNSPVTTALGLVASTALGIIGFMSGCSTSNADDGCDAYVKAQTECSGHLAEGYRAGGANFQARYRVQCRKGVSALGSGFTADYLVNCAHALSALSCEERLKASPKECEDPAGRLPDGSSCADSAQCSSRFCKRPSAGCGVCTAAIAEGDTCLPFQQCAVGTFCNLNGDSGLCLKRRALGAPCYGDVSSCVDGLTCNVSGTCGVPGGTGAPCNADRHCLPDLTCPEAAETEPRRCAARAGEGERCPAPQTGGGCQLGLFCNSKASTCQTQPIAGPGAACDSTVTRCYLASCVPATHTSAEGTCPTIIPDGQPCDPTSIRSFCDHFATCTDGICQVSDKWVCK